MLLITTSILILVNTIIDKDIKPLLKQIKNIDWRSRINTLIDKLRPWALKAGRVTARPLLQFYYVMAVAATLSITNTLRFKATSAGVYGMSGIFGRSRERLYSCMAAPYFCTDEANEIFF